jgi:hypothetical protein
MSKDSIGEYSASFTTPSTSPLAPPPTKFLTPGSYTLDNGSGGTDVGPFKVNVTVPPALVWSNKASITTVPRSNPLTINWTGGGATGITYVVGISPLSIDASGTSLGGAEFVCVAPSAAGTLTVPASVLSALPPSGVLNEGGIMLGGGIIIVSAINTTPSTVPGLDVFIAGASSGDGKIGVTFQ